MKNLIILIGLIYPLILSAQSNSLTRSTPAAQGIPSKAITKLIDRFENEIDAVHSYMIVRHGVVVSEGWWHPYNRNTSHVMHSLSKSFTSTAVGLAISEGKLSLDDPIISFFPDETPKDPSNYLKAMRIRDLITMNTGHIEEPPVWSQEKDWAKFFLSLEVPLKPGTHFKYNSAATYMLSAIIQKVTSEKVVDYLTPRLFEPLGIEKPEWDNSPDGINTGGWGLHIKTEDIAKLGQLYLNKGTWMGKRILSEEWVNMATSKQVANGSNPNNDWEQGYGFQFWRCRYDNYRGDGAFGQFCIVIPEHDAVVAVTSGVNDMGKVMKVIWETLLPAFKDYPLSEIEQDFHILNKKSNNLSLKAIEGKDKSSIAKKVSKKKYEVAENPAGVKSVTFSLTGNDKTISFDIGNEQETINIGFDKYQEDEVKTNLPYTNRLMKKVASSGAWISDNEYQVRVYLYEMPARITYTFKFENDELIWTSQLEHSLFGPREQPQIKGNKE